MGKGTHHGNDSQAGCGPWKGGAALKMCSAGCTPGPAAQYLTLAPRGPPVAKQPARAPCKQLKQQDSGADLSGRGLCWFSKDKASDELRPRKTKAQRECDLWLQSSVVSPAQSDHGHWGRWLQPGVTRGSRGTSCPRLSEMTPPPPQTPCLQSSIRRTGTEAQVSIWALCVQQ